MSDLTWLGYVGAVSGAIGTVTGVAGAVMGFIGFQNSRAMKSLDLRLALRKDETGLRTIMQHLRPHLDLLHSS
jgi:hypothetical protein